MITPCLRKAARFSAILATLAFLTACSTQQKIDTQEQPFSGYLEHYDRMQSIDGDKAMRWASGDLREYDKIYVAPVKLFPNYDATNHARSEIAQKVANYLNEGFRSELRKRGKLADKPGPGVLVIDPAITGIVSERKDLKPRQFVLPVAVARTLIKTATDRLDYVVALYFEVQLRDGETGQLKGEVLRKGLGKQSDNDEITRDDVKSVLDDWLEFYSQGLDKLESA